MIHILFRLSHFRPLVVIRKSQNIARIAFAATTDGVKMTILDYNQTQQKAHSSRYVLQGKGAKTQFGNYNMQNVIMNSRDICDGHAIISRHWPLAKSETKMRCYIF